jgi:hypothetical protein
VSDTPPLLRPRAPYVLIGHGEHTEVYQRHGAARCVQVFRPDCGLTPKKVRDEYGYLRLAYAALPGLIPTQHQFETGAGGIAHTVLVKTWIDVDPDAALNRIRRRDLSGRGAADLRRFIATTRDLLERAGHQDGVLLPDIIDHRFENLCLDTTGHLRLLDTNRLINTKALRALPPGQLLDTEARPIHAAFLRRLIQLDARYARTMRQVAADPLYQRYLTSANIVDLLDRAARAERTPRPRRGGPVTAPGRVWHDENCQ